ncbi:hypothetical protein ABW19_dt0210475 [Dactylella cylindrospora]|nr:hypothetical protein ABW19_dt0210475 [Dactylella cylindrospora]
MDPIAASSPKNNATGGGKAWSEEEETYLLQKRSEKVAYKKIALQLNKTELACRLHFHQLQRGSNRRRRNLSLSSSDGTGAMTPSVYSNTGYASSSYPDLSRRSASPTATPPAGELRYRDRSSYSPQHPRYHSLTHSPSAFASRQLDNPSDVDVARLQKIVDHHRRNMWAAVAADYGEGATPEFLEGFWNKRQEYERKPTTPPTPMVSPRAESEQLTRGVSPHQTQSHPLNQHPRKATREGRPWELETPVSENKRYELFGPELHNGVTGGAHHHHVHHGGLTEMSRYTTERKASNGSSHSSHRSISVESIIAPTEVVMRV